MIELIQSLRKNKTLISLNIGNNKLENAIGGDLRKMLEEQQTPKESYYVDEPEIELVKKYRNITIIDLEIQFNHFSLEDVSYNTD